MVGEPRSARAPSQLFEALQMLAVKRLRGTEVHGNAMLDDPVLLQYLVQYGKSPAAIDHVVLRNDLEPVDDRLLRENVVVVRYPEADPHTVIRKPVKAIGWHQDPRNSQLNVVEGLERPIQVPSDGNTPRKPWVAWSRQSHNRPDPCSCSCRDACRRPGLCNRSFPYRSASSYQARFGPRAHRPAPWGRHSASAGRLREQRCHREGRQMQPPER